MKHLQHRLIYDPEFLKTFEGVPIIGVAGPNGSGKDELLVLMQYLGYLPYNVGDDFRQISRAVMGSVRRGGNNSPTGQIASDRTQAYPGGCIDNAMIDWWHRIGLSKPELRPVGLVVGSIRRQAEVGRLKEVCGLLVVVTADREIRYSRVNGGRSGRAYESGMSFEEFCAEEDAELAAGETDPKLFTMQKVIDAADITIKNESTLEAFAYEALKELSGTLNLSLKDEDLEKYLHHPR